MCEKKKEQIANTLILKDNNEVLPLIRSPQQIS